MSSLAASSSAASAPSGQCAVCSVACIKSCASCHQVNYCGPEHQRQHWPTHRQHCKAARKPPSTAAAAAGRLPTASSSMPASGLPLPPPDAWADGLSPSQQLSWIIDCYRMRLDDDACWSGLIRGVYSSDADKMDVTVDFLHFCLAAQRRLVLSRRIMPDEQRWAALLETALSLVPFALEKSDAQDKWGGENVFSAASGGRSLRYTAEKVYGGGAMWGGGQDMLSTIVREEIGHVLDLARDRPGAFFNPACSASLLAPVGGPKLWKKFHQRLRLTGRR